MKNTGRILRRTLAVIGAAAGLLVAASGAHATTYYNMTGTNGSGVDANGNPVSGTSTFNATINGAIFQTGSNTNNVGTGVFQPFVRIQQNGEGNCNDPCIESGFNTDGTAKFETKDAGGSNWDHSLLLSNISTETIGGVKYRVFALDINESKSHAGDSFLSLDKLQVYMAGAGNLSDFKETSPDGVCTSGCGLQGATKIWDMDGTPGSATDRTVGLDYKLNSGSGLGIDMTVRIRDDLFDPNNGQYVYLYSSFGATGTLKGKNWSPEDATHPPPDTNPAGVLPDGQYGQSAGFEEWSSKVSKLPEPMTLGLLLLGLTALGFSQRKRGSAALAIR